MKLLFHCACLLAALSPLCTADAVLAPSTSSSGWVLDWNDEFEGDSLDTDKWNYQTGLSNTGTSHCYTEDAVSVRDGSLIITSTYEETANPHYDPDGTSWRTTTETQPYSSGAINTRGTQDFLYGRLEVRAKVTDTTGIWPAIWLLGDVPGNTWSSPKCGEIDILEHVSQDEGLVQTAFHWGKDGSQTLESEHYSHQIAPEDYFDQYHTYAIEWNEGGVKVFVDDVLFGTFDSDVANYPDGQVNPFRKPQYLILNTAIGGESTWPENANPSEYPSEFAVDYVRYYVEQAPEQATLRYAYDFDSYYSNFSLDIGENQAEFKGSSQLTNMNGLWMNIRPNGMGGGASWAHAIHSGVVGFVGANALNMTFDDGFTVASNFRFAGTSATSQDTLLSFKISEQDYTLSYSNAKGGFVLATQVGGTLTESEVLGFQSLTDTNKEWFSFILSGQLVDGEGILTLSIYSTDDSATLLGTISMDGFDADALLGDFSFSNAATPDLGLVTLVGGIRQESYHVDNLLVYEGAATQADLFYLASSLAAGEYIQKIPEPSSVTMSLLALSGLLARRRRRRRPCISS